MQKYKILLLAVVVLMITAMPSAAQRSRKSVSVGEVTGTFRMTFPNKKFKGMGNYIYLASAGRGKLQVAFDLIYPYMMQNDEVMVNIGVNSGYADIEGDTAVFTDEDYGKCKITIKFVKPGMISVEQSTSEPSCGFGHNVWATGTYLRTDSKKPDFAKVIKE